MDRENLLQEYEETVHKQATLLKRQQSTIESLREELSNLQGKLVSAGKQYQNKVESLVQQVHSTALQNTSDENSVLKQELETALKEKELCQAENKRQALEVQRLRQELLSKPVASGETFQLPVHQECNRDNTCIECQDWDDKKWKVLKSHLDKFERDRKRKAASRAKNRASLESTPLPRLVEDSAIPSPLVRTLSPILSPPTSLRPSPMPGSHASSLDAIASLESRFDQKISLVKTPKETSPLLSDEEDCEQTSPSPSVYVALLKFFLASSPDFFTPAAPVSPASTFLMRKQPDDSARLPKVITNRIAGKLDENQPREQAGFRRGYSTIDHLQTVNQIIEKTNKYKIPQVAALVDYTKAFDSVKTEEVMSVLEEPWQEKGIRIDGECLSHLRFADDVIIIAPTKEELQQMLTKLNEASKSAGLHMNFHKTKVMSNKYTVLKGVPGVERLEGTDHTLVHRLEERGGVGREELKLDSLVMKIERVATSIIHNKQHLELHAQVVQVLPNFRDEALMEPVLSVKLSLDFYIFHIFFCNFSIQIDGLIFKLEQSGKEINLLKTADKEKDESSLELRESYVNLNKQFADQSEDLRVLLLQAKSLQKSKDYLTKVLGTVNDRLEDAKQRVSESVRIAEDALVEKDAALLREKHALDEVSRLESTVSSLMEEMGGKAQAEVLKIKDDYNSNIKKLSQEVVRLEMALNGKQLEYIRAVKDKERIESELEQMKVEFSKKKEEHHEEILNLHQRISSQDNRIITLLNEKDSSLTAHGLRVKEHEEQREELLVRIQELEDHLVLSRGDCESLRIVHEELKREYQITLANFKRLEEESKSNDKFLKRQLRAKTEELEEVTSSSSIRLDAVDASSKGIIKQLNENIEVLQESYSKLQSQVETQKRDYEERITEVSQRLQDSLLKYKNALQSAHETKTELAVTKDIASQYSNRIEELEARLRAAEQRYSTLKKATH
ncbi:sodium channel and clathrin linker 1-like [Macrobrachium rosenbergii]|uniref:sodium channel and clathrin linker 1-like n=1 Tax=Macrobrachium rosenbergii TaxID=79674 RepID=UPI0034D460D2